MTKFKQEVIKALELWDPYWSNVSDSDLINAEIKILLKDIPKQIRNSRLLQKYIHWTLEKNF